MIKDIYDKGGINFFDDGIAISGTSNLEDSASASCKLRIESNANVTHGVSYGVLFRMGILEESAGNRRGTNPILRPLPKNEMGIGLALGEARVLCEALYKLANQDSDAKAPVEIAFSGDNAPEFKSRTSYVRRSKVEARFPLTIKIDPAVSIESAAKITLETQAKENVSFCSANLTAQNALILSFILRCSFMQAFDCYGQDLLLYENGLRPELKSERPTVLEEATRYGEQIVERTRKLYNPDSDADNAKYAAEITMLVIQIIQGYGGGPFEKW
jgi:hypothetical protein